MDTPGSNKAKRETDSRGKETHPLILRPSKVKHGSCFLGSLLFVSGGILMVLEGKDAVLAGWIGVLFFGLCALIFAINLLPHSSYLLLEPEGFTVRSLFRDRFTPWSEVEQFFPSFAGANPIVVYDENREGGEKLPGSTWANKISKALCIHHKGLPDTYGMDPPELADLLNIWRDSALLLEEET
jgi:hypothetical protein